MSTCKISIKNSIIKQVSTLGPSSSSSQVLQNMIDAGLSVGRLNFSHGTYEYHEQLFKALMSCESVHPIAALLDTKGPEIRIGKIKNDSCELKANSTLTLTTQTHDKNGNPILGDPSLVSISHENLPKEVKKGTRIYLDDGLIFLEVLEINGQNITTKVLNNSILKSNKGVNVPGVSLSIPTLSEKDIADIRFGMKLGVDFIAASFIQRGSDIEHIRKLVEDKGDRKILIYAKIECELGVQNFDEILEESDGIMIARGDLGIEVPVVNVIKLQKEFIKKCNKAGKPVIVATQMLQSMTSSPRPTRAEVADNYNAVLDGTDAVMLSAESASGKYPVESVRYQNEISKVAISVPDSFEMAILATSKDKTDLELYQEILKKIKKQDKYTLVVTTNEKVSKWLSLVKNCVVIYKTEVSELRKIVSEAALKNEMIVEI